MNALLKVPSSLDPFAPREGAIRPTEQPLNQGVMLFDIVITPRTPEAKHRLERAMLWDRDGVNGCSTPAGWLNAQIVSGIECAEDEMWVDAATGELVDENGDTIERGEPQQPALFVVSQDIIERAARLAEFWEIEPNDALAELSWLERSMQEPHQAGEDAEHYSNGDPEREKRVRARLAALVRQRPAKEYGTARRREVWARIVQFGRLPGDNGSGQGFSEDAYMTAPTHQP